MRVGMAAHDDDLLGAEALRRDHAAQADGAVADDGDAMCPGATRATTRRVVAGAHDVGEREQRRHPRVVFADVERVERSVGERDAERFGLRAVHAAIADEADVHARGREALVAELARAVGDRERHHDDLAALDACERRCRRLRRRRSPRGPCSGRSRSSACRCTARGRCRRCRRAVTRRMASVGSTIDGSGTFSTRTSPAPYMMVARMAQRPPLPFTLKMGRRWARH